MKLSSRQKKKIRKRFGRAAQGEHVVCAMFQPCGQPDTEGLYRGRIRVLVSTDSESSLAGSTISICAAVRKAVRGILRSPEIAVTQNPYAIAPARSPSSGKPYVLNF